MITIETMLGLNEADKRLLHAAVGEPPEEDISSYATVIQKLYNHAVRPILQSNKPWVGFDLDGTLARYDGWKGQEHIGTPVEKMFTHFVKHIQAGKTVKIFTARAVDQAAIPFIHDWLEKHLPDDLKHLARDIDVTCIKDMFCTEFYDDRAVSVQLNTGNWTGFDSMDREPLVSKDSETEVHLGH